MINCKKGGDFLEIAEWKNNLEKWNKDASTWEKTKEIETDKYVKRVYVNSDEKLYEYYRKNLVRLLKKTLDKYQWEIDRIYDNVNQITMYDGYPNVRESLALFIKNSVKKQELVLDVKYEKQNNQWEIYITFLRTIDKNGNHKQYPYNEWDIKTKEMVKEVIPIMYKAKRENSFLKLKNIFTRDNYTLTIFPDELKEEFMKLK